MNLVNCETNDRWFNSTSTFEFYIKAFTDSGNNNQQTIKVDFSQMVAWDCSLDNQNLPTLQSIIPPMNITLDWENDLSRWVNRTSPLAKDLQRLDLPLFRFSGETYRRIKQICFFEVKYYENNYAGFDYGCDKYKITRED